MKLLGEEESTLLFAAIGKFIVRFSHMNSIVELMAANLIAKSGDGRAHRRVQAVLCDLTAKPLAKAFFAALVESRETPFTADDQLIISTFRKELNALIEERNRIAHDVWSLGGHPNNPRPSSEAWNRIRGSSSEVKGFLVSAAPITIEYLDSLSEDAWRLNLVVRQLALAGITGTAHAPSAHLQLVGTGQGRSVQLRESAPGGSS